MDAFVGEECVSNAHSITSGKRYPSFPVVIGFPSQSMQSYHSLHSLTYCRIEIPHGYGEAICPGHHTFKLTINVVLVLCATLVCRSVHHNYKQGTHLRKELCCKDPRWHSLVAVAAGTINVVPILDFTCICCCILRLH